MARSNFGAMRLAATPKPRAAAHPESCKIQQAATTDLRVCVCPVCVKVRVCVLTLRDQHGSPLAVTISLKIDALFARELVVDLWVVGTAAFESWRSAPAQNAARAHGIANNERRRLVIYATLQTLFVQHAHGHPLEQHIGAADCADAARRYPARRECVSPAARDRSSCVGWVGRLCRSSMHRCAHLSSSAASLGGLSISSAAFIRCRARSVSLSHDIIARRFARAPPPRSRPISQRSSNAPVPASMRPQSARVTPGCEASAWQRTFTSTPGGCMGGPAAHRLHSTTQREARRSPPIWDTGPRAIPRSSRYHTLLPSVFFR